MRCSKYRVATMPDTLDWVCMFGWCTLALSNGSDKVGHADYYPMGSFLPITPPPPQNVPDPNVLWGLGTSAFKYRLPATTITHR